MATSMEENPSGIPDTSKDEPSFVTDEESSEEEQEDVMENGGEEGDDDDDGYALLALTKRRIQEQKEKEAEAVPTPSNEEDDTEEEDDESDANGGDGEQEEDEVAENEKDEGVVGENEHEHEDEQVSASDAVQQETSSSPSTSSKDEEKKEYSSGDEGGVRNAAGQIPRKSPDIPEGTHQANAELWALLNQSKKRLGGKAAVLNIDSVAPKSPSRSTSGGSPSQGGGDPSAAAPAPKTQEELLREVLEKKDKNAVTVQESINARRDMDKEDAELRALLDATKKRLALAAEKAKTPEEKAAVKKKMENPYADLDVPEDQKQLLIAMAIAEEAARSGQETFATAELKTEDLSRSIDSFAFLKNKGKKPQQES